MIIPKGRAIYENLNTSFTNLNELLTELKNERHTGFMRVRYWDYEAVIYFDGGKIINGVEERGDERILGPEAVSGLIEKAQEKDGAISVYQLPAETVTLMASSIRGEVVHRDLSSEFTNLPKLIEKLRSESHTGYIEVSLQNIEGTGMIFMQAGDPIASVLSVNGETNSGPNALHQIIDIASSHAATFNVYRAELESIIADGEQVMAGLDLPSLIKLWGEILSSIERVIASVGEGKTFHDTFKDVRLQNAERHPFLDPFLAQFRYEDGGIEVQGVSPRQLNMGLSETLLETIQQMDDKLPDSDLQRLIRESLVFIRESHADEFERFGVTSWLPGYFE